MGVELLDKLFELGGVRLCHVGWDLGWGGLCFGQFIEAWGVVSMLGYDVCRQYVCWGRSIACRMVFVAWYARNGILYCVQNDKGWWVRCRTAGDGGEVDG